MNRNRPFFSSTDPRPPNIQEPDDPRPPNIQEPDDPRPPNIQEPDDPRPPNIQEPDDPRPPNIQEPDDPEVAYALGILKGRLTGRRRRPRRRRGGGRDGADDGRPPGNVEPTGTPEQYSGHVVVRLSSHLDLEAVDTDPSEPPPETLGKLAEKLGLNGLQKVLRRHGLGRKSRRLVATDEKVNDDYPQEDKEPRTVYELEKEAAESDLPPRHSLAAYWRLDVRDEVGDTEPKAGEARVDGWTPGHVFMVEKIVDELNELVEVDRAYRELAVSDPQHDVYGAIQEHLERAPLGINARWAAAQENGTGAGTALVDLEQGWLPDHEDLIGHPLDPPIFGDNRHGVGQYRGHHGTAVVGLVAAAANDLGVAGIAPDVGSVRVVSHYDASTNESLHVAHAIRQAIPRMQRGDVLLLEVQRSYLPTEVDDADLDAIRLAVAHGIIVIEAAGNGETDLDRYADADGEPVLNRRSPHFRESGAIMVGAARAARPHDRFAGPVGVGSNYGSRLDCFGFGDRATTAGYGDLEGDPSGRSAYTDVFGGTSAAAPIVAGAALVVQGMVQARLGGSRLSPWEMRGLLSHPASGTRQGRGVAGHVGVMPDLKKILRDHLQLVPAPYLRDHLGDDGAAPARRRIGASPDILVTGGPTRSNPQRKYGEGSGTENAYPEGGRCAPKTNHAIFLRLRNRGLRPLSAPRARVFWSEVATLVTPDAWNEIPVPGRFALLDAPLPEGDVLTVSKAIPWPKEAVNQALAAAGGSAGGARHLCFVALVEDPFDEPVVLPPSHPPYFRWDLFRNFQRRHPNLALCNVHRVDEDPAPPGNGVELPFVLSGTPDLARVFDFEIVQRLPAGTTVQLEVPAAVAASFGRKREWRSEPIAGRRRRRLHLPARPRIGISRVRLVAGARFPCVFRVRGPGVSRGHGLTLRQLYRGEEVGRITWHFAC